MRRNPWKIQSEDELHAQVAQYLRLKYPDVLFRTDFAAGTKLSKIQAVRNKGMQMEESKGWPDLFIAQHKHLVISDGTYEETKEFHYGLFIELKTEDVKLYLKDGVTMVANEHYRSQAKMLEKLRKVGYKAEFAVGYDHAVRIIDDYLS